MYRVIAYEDDQQRRPPFVFHHDHQASCSSACYSLLTVIKLSYPSELVKTSKVDKPTKQEIDGERRHKSCTYSNRRRCHQQYNNFSNEQEGLPQAGEMLIPSPTYSINKTTSCLAVTHACNPKSSAVPSSAKYMLEKKNGRVDYSSFVWEDVMKNSKKTCVCPC